MVDFIVGILNSIGSGVGDDLVADLLKTPAEYNAEGSICGMSTLNRTTFFGTPNTEHISITSRSIPQNALNNSVYNAGRTTSIVTITGAISELVQNSNSKTTATVGNALITFINGATIFRNVVFL